MTSHPGHGRLRSLNEADRAAANGALLEVVEYRESGLSLNWIAGCPLDCGYCVRHLFANFTMKTPHALTGDRAALSARGQPLTSGSLPRFPGCQRRFYWAHERLDIDSRLTYTPGRERWSTGYSAQPQRSTQE